MNPTHPAAQFLRRHRWRARGTLLVWALAATAAAGASLGARHLGWFAHGAEGTLAATGVALLLLGAWFRRVHGLTPRGLARELDTRWALRSRLESAVELSTDASGWAEAQRDDATRQLAGRSPPGGRAWFAGHAALALLAGLVAVEVATWTWRALPAPAAAAAKTAKAATPAGETPASIAWKSPQSEIKATAIEEVPLVALAESRHGFRSFALKLTINGEREVSQPVEAPGDTATGGAHEVKPSVFLDELNVKAGDMVTYRLVGELGGPTPRHVSSPLQFVEIRVPRRDAAMKGGGGSELVARLFELKARQLQLVKQNFTLQQLAEAGPDATWPAENTRVAAEQDALAVKAEELQKMAREAHVPGAVVSKLDELPPLMREAGKEIAAKENEAALKPQNRALAIITDIAKEIGVALAGGSANDPIRDEQAFQLPPRTETPAGELEKLAERQNQNNQQLAANAAAPGADDHGAGEAQEAIARDAEKLAAAGTLDPAVKSALDSATAAAAAAARQLAAHDNTAARVPAAEAQRAFEAAVAAQENAGRAGAVVELEQLRRALNAASRAGDAAQRTQILRTARDQLRAAAVQQQRTGSADAARDLVRLAQLIDAAKDARGTVTTATEKNSAERAREVATTAAQAQVGLTPRNDAINRAVRRLRRVGPGGTTPPAQSAPLDELEMASQEAQWLTGDAATLELARQLVTQADAWQRAGNRPPPPEATEGAAKLATALERGRASGQRDEIVRRFNPADIEPAYRAAVENYFERLSRDTRPAAQPAAK